MFLLQVVIKVMQSIRESCLNDILLAVDVM